MSKRKYYETTIEVTVLSEEPFEFYGLDDIHYAITDGDCVGEITSTEIRELTPAQAAKGLYLLGSEPGFFELDNEGNELEPSEEQPETDNTKDDTSSHIQSGEQHEDN